MLLKENEMCSRIGKLWRGCRFESRYDVFEPTVTLQKKLEAAWSITELDKEKLLMQKIYVQDVCIRCGRVIDRNG
jgi:hypothetical protein